MAPWVLERADESGKRRRTHGAIARLLLRPSAEHVRMFVRLPGPTGLCRSDPATQRRARRCSLAARSAVAERRPPA